MNSEIPFFGFVFASIALRSNTQEFRITYFLVLLSIETDLWSEVVRKI